MDAELKFKDTSYAAAAPAAAGTITNSSLVLVTQGTGQSERIGRNLTVAGISIQGAVRLPSNALPGLTYNSDRVRVLLYLDTQANGAAATPGLLLTPTVLDGHYNPVEQDRFTILDESTAQLSHQAGDTRFAENVHSFALEFYGDEIPIEYSGTAGVLTELRSNNIGVLRISDNADATVSYEARVYYYG